MTLPKGHANESILYVWPLARPFFVYWKVEAACPSICEQQRKRVMAKTRDYMDYLDEFVEISPANSEEEYQAAEVIAGILKDHELETSVESFETHPAGTIMLPMLMCIMFGCLVATGLTEGPLHYGTLVATLVCAGLSVFMHISGTNFFENFGPASQSQNVVGVHRATGGKVVKGARPIVIVAHYDTPRESLLRKGPLVRLQTSLPRMAAPLTIAIVVFGLLLAIPVLPGTIRTFLWVISVLVALPIIFLSIMNIYEHFAPCTQGANDNKSSVAALLSIANKVRPHEDRVDRFIADGNESLLRRVGDKPPAPAMPTYVEVVEETKGVRHGAEVLLSLGILPPNCDVVYEEPRVTVVQEGVVEQLEEVVVDEPVSYDAEPYEFEDDADVQLEQDQEPELDQEPEQELEPEVPVEEVADLDEVVELEQPDEADEQAYDEVEEYEEDDYEEEDYDEDEDYDYEDSYADDSTPSSIGVWLKERWTSIREYISKHRGEDIDISRGKDRTKASADDEDEVDEFEDEVDFEEEELDFEDAEAFEDEDAEEPESFEDDYEQDDYEQDDYEQGEDEEQEAEFEEEYDDGYLDESESDELEFDEPEPEPEFDEPEPEPEFEEDEWVEDDEEGYEEPFEDEYEETFEDEPEDSEPEEELEDAVEEDDQDWDIEADWDDEDHNMPTQIIEEEDEGEFELDEEEYHEEYEEYEYGDYEDVAPALSLIDRIKGFFRGLRESQGRGDYAEDYEEYDYGDEYEGEYDDEYEAYEEEDAAQDGEALEGAEEEPTVEEGTGEFLDDDLYFEEDYDVEGYYAEDEDVEPYEEVEEESPLPDDFDEPLDRPEDPNVLHFDYEEDLDIIPRDTTGLDTISDSYDLYSGEVDRVSHHNKPEPVEDPSWGVTSYQPARPAMNIARRAALLDLPDPSEAFVDPLSYVGGYNALDFDDYGDDEYDAYVAYEEEVQEDAYEQVVAEPAVAEEPAAVIGANAIAEDVLPDERFEGSYLDLDDIDDEDLDWESQESEEVTVTGEGHKSFWGTSGSSDWKGGAATRADLREDLDEPIIIDAEDLQDAILELGDEYLVAHDIWFVATGASETHHAGIKAFMDNHKRDIHGAFLVNLDSIGAGSLSILVREGVTVSKRADRRLVRMLTSIAQDLHVQVETAMHNWSDRESTISMQSRIRSVTVMGLDENDLPANSHTSNDVPEWVNPHQVSDVVRMVTELIRRS